MTDAFLILSNLLFGISILLYFYFKEVHTKKDDNGRIDKLDDFYSRAMDKLQTIQLENIRSLEEISCSKDELFKTTFMEYLKHNEKLEKMVLPQPVTKKAVQDILNQTGPMVPNEIEKDDAELEKEQLDDMLARIPITKDTKITFEEDMVSGGGKIDNIDDGLQEEIQG